MERRTVLKLLGTAGVTGAGGCLGPTDNAAVAETNERHVSIAHQESVPEKHQLRIEASLLEPTVTADHPARLQATLTNEGSEHWIRANRGCPLFWKSGWASTPEGVLLPFSDDPDYVSEQGPRWVITPPEDVPWPDVGCGAERYESGESFRTEYAVYDDGRFDGYLAPGTYTFGDVVQMPPRGSEPHETSDPVLVSWEFALAIDAPD